MQKSKRKNIILAGILAFILMFGMFSLAGCGEPPHEHNWAESYSHDAEQHWHACTGCDEKFGFTAHYFFDEHDAVCDTCGYERSIGDHAAETDWAQNGTHHWHNCQHDGCTIKFDEANHDYTDDHDATCNTCGYTRSLGDHGNSSSLRSDATGHWHACSHSDCDYKYDFVAHTPDEHGYCTNSNCKYYVGTQLRVTPGDSTSEYQFDLGTLEAGTYYYCLYHAVMPGSFKLNSTNLSSETYCFYTRRNSDGAWVSHDGNSYFAMGPSFSYDALGYLVITLTSKVENVFIRYNYRASEGY